MSINFEKDVENTKDFIKEVRTILYDIYIVFDGLRHIDSLSSKSEAFQVSTQKAHTEFAIELSVQSKLANSGETLLEYVRKLIIDKAASWVPKEVDTKENDLEIIK